MPIRLGVPRHREVLLMKVRHKGIASGIRIKYAGERSDDIAPPRAGYARKEHMTAGAKI
jgi:hypothetical protein